MTRYGLYGVYSPTPITPSTWCRFGMCVNRKLALRFARNNAGVEVRRMDRPLTSDGYDSFDGTTFRVLSTRIYPQE